MSVKVQREYNVIGSGQTFQRARVEPDAEEMASARVYGNATMSSTYSKDADAEKCNDRKSDTRCITKWTQGRGENNPWWQLDMGKKERIVKVRILSEPDSRCQLSKYVNMTCTLKGAIVGVSSRPCVGTDEQEVYVQLEGNRNLHFWELIAYKVAMAVPAKGTPSTSARAQFSKRKYNLEKIQFFAKPDGCEALESHDGVHCNPYGAVFGVSMTPCKGWKISSDGVCDGYICGNLTERFYKEDWFEISCGGMAGRYVFVQLPGKRVLNFFELKPFKAVAREPGQEYDFMDGMAQMLSIFSLKTGRGGILEQVACDPFEAYPLVYVQLPGSRVLNFHEMLVFESKDPYAKYKDEVEDIRGGMRTSKYAWTFQVHNYDKVMHYVAADAWM
ncbi:hypothetical protein AK812_SmicGene33894 [Symbiodinium microadriaticum]|uniref:F5/8 type C domain-containing protein n=1 Tax=Symbiodinium microadriaticum TaxID=2951 RepID=A0A1Q9CQF0_SYMMI|nr:hypothetical protein AK812_SmicGene33894 [Symbiodinium microadriaticum]